MHVINIDGKQSKGIHWVSLFIDRNMAVYFDSFGTEYFPQDVLNKIKDEYITHNIFRIQSDDSIMYRFYCINFIEYMIAGNTLLDYTNLFCTHNFQRNCKTTYKYCEDKYDKRTRMP